MDERISKALAELRRAGISPLDFTTRTAGEQEYTNQEIADLLWAIAKKRAPNMPNLGRDEDKQHAAFSALTYWHFSMMVDASGLPAPGSPDRPGSYPGPLCDYMDFPV